MYPFMRKDVYPFMRAKLPGVTGFCGNHQIRRCSGLRSRGRGRLGVREPGPRFAPYGASSSPTHLLAAVPDAERHAGRKTQVPEVHEVGLEPKRHALGEMDVNPAARLKGESLFDISSRNVRRYVRRELLVYPENHRARQNLNERRDSPAGPGIPDAGPGIHACSRA